MTLRVCAIAAISFLAGTTATLTASQQVLLTGTVTYRERIALPATAIVEVRLEDVSRADGVPPIVARTRIADPGSVPVRFNLDVDTSTLDRRGRYAVRASITDGKEVLFLSMDTVLVLTQGHGSRADLTLTRVGSAKPVMPAPAQVPPPPVSVIADLPATFIGTLPCADCEGIRYHLNLFGDDSFLLRTTRLGKASTTTDDLGSWTLSSDRRFAILKGRGDAVHVFEVTAPGTLRKLDANGRVAAGAGSYLLTRTSPFRLTEVRASMRGAYMYLADAATFVECSTGQRWAVAAERASKELETSYLKVRSAPGAAVIVEVEGLTTSRPRPDGGMETALVVERVGRLVPNETCPARFSGAPLTETYWRLTHLGDRAVAAAADVRREPALTFLADGRSFSGSSGCNRVVGTYSTSTSTSSMTLTSGGTMIACKEEAKTEAAFMAALKETRAYRILGRVLELTDAKGARIARFEARQPTGITIR